MGNSRDKGSICVTNYVEIDGPVRCINSQPRPLAPSGFANSNVNPGFDTRNYQPIRQSGRIVGWYRSSSGYSEVRNTDGRIVWSHELPLEKVRIPVLDTAIEVAEETLKQVGYAAIGTFDTVLENNWSALGLKLDAAHREPFAQKLGIPVTAKAYTLGRTGGHLLSLLQAAAETVSGVTMMISGAGEFLAGVATTPEGVGVVIVPVAVVTVATGTAVVIHGGVLGSATFMNAMHNGGGSEAPKQPSIRPPSNVPKTPEIKTTFKGNTPQEAFGKARADAIANAKLKPDKIPFRSEAGPPHEIGRVKGSMNKDGVSGGWRLDFDPKDPSKGLHINWWRMENGTYFRGANVVEGGTEAMYWEILSHFPF